jgi:predicted outer membrane lipoprotein
VTAAAHLFLAWTVHRWVGRDAGSGSPTTARRVGPGRAWVLATLVAGVFGVLAYWLTHRSRRGASRAP